DEVRKVIDAQWLDEESKQQLRETFRVTDADLAAKERAAANERETAASREAAPPQEAKEGEAADKCDETGEHEAENGGNPTPPAEAKAQAANGRAGAGKRGQASKRPASGPREDTGEREPAKQRETAGQAGAAD